MNRHTRDRFASGTQADLTTGNAVWQTPPAVFAKLHEEYRFDVDLTADPIRRLLPVWCGRGGRYENALTAPWLECGTRGYSNPPYGPFVALMLARARAFAALGFFTGLLLPLRVTKAFRAHVLRGASDLLFCDRRLTFWENGAPRLNRKALEKGRLVGDPALFDSIIVLYEPGVWERPRMVEWHVPTHVTREDLERARARLSDPLPADRPAHRSGIETRPPLIDLPHSAPQPASS